MTSPAFKEWHVIVEALGAGAQTIILRKGGISEGRGGFQIAANQFWLFPTRFHAQQEKTKPAAASWYPSAEPQPDQLQLRFTARLEAHRFITDPAELERLDPLHFWTRETVEERFSWSKPPGVHLLLVRVFRLLEPVQIEVTAEMAGCKSWVDLPLSFEDHPATPVLDDPVFTSVARQLFQIP
jgi:hypothetical protein